MTKERKGVDKSNVFPYNSNCVWKKDGKIINMVARVAQLVEHNLAKVGAAGSSPVSRLKKATDFHVAFFGMRMYMILKGFYT